MALKTRCLGPLVLGFTFAILIVRSAEAQSPKLVVLPELPGGVVYNEAIALSDDGNVVIGISSTQTNLDAELTRAYSWTQNRGILEIPLSPRENTDCTLRNGTDVSSRPIALSADGSIIRGMESIYCSSGPPFNMGWTVDYLSGGSTLRIPGDNVMKSAGPMGLSADGSIMVAIGEATGGSTRLALWQFSTGFKLIGSAPPNGLSPTLNAVDSAARLVGGTARGLAAIWEDGKGETVLSHHATTFGTVKAVSRDGRYLLVQDSVSSWLVLGGQWTEIQADLKCPDGFGGFERPHETEVLSVSDAGEVVGRIACRVRGTSSPLSTSRAVYWDRTHNLHDLNSEVRQFLGNVWLIRAKDISTDGRVIIGTGYDGNDSVSWYLDTR